MLALLVPASFLRPLSLLLLSRPKLASSWMPHFQAPSLASSKHHRKLHLYSSGSSDLPAEEPSRWDQMFQEGEARRNHLNALMNPEIIPSSSDQLVSDSLSSPVRVVTFDLDNTLWNTGATIGKANDVLSQFLNENQIVQSKRTEKIMGDLFQTDKLKYCPLADPQELDKVKAPVLLTQLRKDALQQILIQDNGYGEEDAKDFASKAFDKWMEARYSAIPSSYATDVLSVLDQISNLALPASSHPILVGAITDGNSDPRNVPELNPYFDFCINAEQVGVAKPDKRVYETAMQYVRQHPYLQDLDTSTLNEDSMAGHWWVHVGDDFTKDVVAAKNLNMRTIWARELILDKLKKETIAAQYNNTADSKPVSAEKQLMDFQEKINSQAVVKMAVGAEDYLVASIQQEFSDAMIDSFADLPKVLQQWQAESQKQPQSAARKEAVYVPEEADLVRGIQSTAASGDTAGDVMNPSISPPPPPPATRGEQVYVPEEADLVRDLLKKSPGKHADTKFCVFCGAKIPSVAVFCSSCSEKQPQVQ